MPPARRAASLGKSRSATLSYPDALSAAWFALDAFTHFVIEGSYLYVALGETAAKSSNPFAAIWREYGRADKRWAGRDPTVISLELLTVFLGGPAAAAMVYAIMRCVAPAAASPAPAPPHVTAHLAAVSAPARVLPFETNCSLCRVHAARRPGGTCCRHCYRWRSCTADG